MYQEKKLVEPAYKLMTTFTFGCVYINNVNTSRVFFIRNGNSLIASRKLFI